MQRNGEVGSNAKDHQLRVRLLQQCYCSVIALGAELGDFFRRHSISLSVVSPPAARRLFQAPGHADNYPTVLIASFSSATHSLTSGDGSAGLASYSILM